MATLYRVQNWDTNFVNAKSRSVKNPTWAPIPTKQDGLGYSRLMRHESGAAIYGAFVALVLRLTKAPVETRHGYVTDTGGREGTPLTAQDINEITKIPSDVADEMLKVLSSKDIGWLVPEQVPNGDAASPQRGRDGDAAGTQQVPNGDATGTPSESPTSPPRRGEEKRGEERGREGTRAPVLESSSEPPSQDPPPDIPTPIPKDLEEIAMQVYGSVPLGNLTEWIRLFPVDWIRRAMAVTERRTKRDASYTFGILQAWKREGKPDDDSTAGIRGSGKPAKTSRGGKPEGEVPEWVLGRD